LSLLLLLSLLSLLPLLLLLLFLVSRLHPEPEAALFAADAKDPVLALAVACSCPCLSVCHSRRESAAALAVACSYSKLTSSTLITGRNPPLPFLLSSASAVAPPASEIGPGFIPDTFAPPRIRTLAPGT